jgi:hypothetical protein
MNDFDSNLVSKKENLNYLKAQKGTSDKQYKKLKATSTKI